VPSDCDRVAVVPDIEDSERNWSLAALARDKCLPGGEGGSSKWCRTARASVVDELVDRVGEILEGLREGCLDEALGERLVDRGLEIGRDLLSLCVAQAAMEISGAQFGPEGRGRGAERER